MRTGPKTAAMGAALAIALLAAPATAQESRSALDTLLGGSFFPFARAIGPAPSPRCKRLADRLRGYRDDGILNVADHRELRRKGCQDVRPYG